jgi:hypothetical protein
MASLCAPLIPNLYILILCLCSNTTIMNTNTRLFLRTKHATGFSISPLHDAASAPCMMQSTALLSAGACLLLPFAASSSHVSWHVHACCFAHRDPRSNVLLATHVVLRRKYAAYLRMCVCVCDVTVITDIYHIIHEFIHVRINSDTCALNTCMHVLRFNHV